MARFSWSAGSKAFSICLFIFLGSDSPLYYHLFRLLGCESIVGCGKLRYMRLLYYVMIGVEDNIWSDVAAPQARQAPNPVELNRRHYSLDPDVL